MTVYPNAKINFGLKVLRKRPDGYHDLETVFVPVLGLCDRLDVELAGKGCGTSFAQAGIAVDCEAEDNLIMRVLRVMQERYGVGDVNISFTKNIPFGAGLGGGSSDAAFMAKVLNRMFGLGLSDTELEQLVAPLGADCAFFVQNRPRLAGGKGEVFSEVPDNFLSKLSGKWLLLVKPPVAVSTAAAYRGIVPNESHFVWDGTLSSFNNDFEHTVFHLFPQIAEVKERLLQIGALHASMSGSGATVFGLFEKQVEKAEELFDGCFVHRECLHF